MSLPADFPYLPNPGRSGGLNALGNWAQRATEMFNRVLIGRTNNTGTVTLRASQTTTVLNDPRLSGVSVITLMPVTAHAQAIALPYPSSQLVGTVTLNHASDANTDKTFSFVITG